MDFYLNQNLFYTCGSIIKLSKKPEGVAEYKIYNNLKDRKLVKTGKRNYFMKKEQLLEVIMQDGERRFFLYDGGFFVSIKGDWWRI